MLKNLERREDGRLGGRRGYDATDVLQDKSVNYSGVVNDGKLYKSLKPPVSMGYDKETLRSFVDAMLKASSIISEEKPDYLVAPMNGSVPFIDSMAIVDKNFDPTRVVYMPASSSISDVNHVIPDWYSNFIRDATESPHFFPKIIGIDEVVSGQSVVRCFKGIDHASQQLRKEIRQDLVERLHTGEQKISSSAVHDADLLTNNVDSYEFGEMRTKIAEGFYKDSANKSKAREDSKFFVDSVRNSLADKLVYRTIGIEDSKKPERSRDYNTLRGDERIIPVSIKDIITMDNPHYMATRFKQIDNPKGQKHIVQFSPVVEGFEVTPDYMDFLTTLAKYSGRNPAEIGPVNMQAILDSKKYLPLKYFGEKEGGTVQGELNL